MKKENKKIIGGIGILSILAIVMGSGLIGQDNVYACENLNIAMQCDSLSAINSEGIQTRCYYFSEEKNRTTYKTCKTGWLKYVPETNIIDKITDTITDIGGESEICRVINKNNLIKECINDKNETYLYMIRF